NLAQAQKAEQLLPSVGTHVETLGRPTQRQFVMSGFEYTAPAQIVLFVFITSLAWAGLGVQTRQLGITRRMYGTPTSAGALVVGETLARFAIALFQAGFIIVVGTLVFGVDFGDPLAVAALVILFCLVGTSFGILGGVLFRTPEQAGSLT